MKNYKMLKIAAFALLLTLPSIAAADREDWYFMFNFGFADHNHPGDIDAAFDALETIPGVDRIEIAMDLLGFYWPIAEQDTIIGFVINSSSDNLSDDFGNDLSLNTYMYSVSGIHYFGQEIGDGFFVRGDFGIAYAEIDSNFGTAESDSGTGFLIGAGFALPVSSQSRLIFGINMADRSIEGESYKVTEFTIGGLW